MSDGVLNSSRELIRYMLRETDMLRSPVILFILAASGSRTAMIFLINETAERGGPTLWLFSGMIGATLVMVLTTHWAKMSGVKLIQAMTLKLRRGVATRLLGVDVAFFQEHEAGNIYHTVTDHLHNLAATPLRLIELVHALLVLLFCLVYMAIQMPSSVLATVIAFVVGVAAFFATEKPAIRADRKRHDETVKFYGYLNDMLRGYKEMRLRRGRRRDLSNLVDDQIEHVQDLAIKTERHFSYGQAGGSLSLAALLISIVVVLPLLGNADSVTILQILTLVLFTFGPIEATISQLPQMARSAISFKIFNDLNARLEADAEVVDKAELENPAPFKTLEMSGVLVNLTRNAGDDGKAVDTFTMGPIDLKLQPGQSVFITGGNGMGKSTLLQVITGLRHPEGGQILLDGEPVTRENVADYRSQFAAVFSEFHLFRRLYGLGDTEKARLREHLEELGLTDIVRIDGDQFASLSLSQGQMRRLALAIALAEQRPIIVLDEFAADQDPIRRVYFYEELVPRLAAAGHCVVAVTHDEHCFDKCDRLIRMEDGKIVSDVLQPRHQIA